MFNKTVTIIGAGPSGLCLAALLQQANIKVRVFERESLTLGRDQGGTLDMHQDYGQIAIKAAGLYQEFMKVSRIEGDAMKILESTTCKLLFQDGSHEQEPSASEGHMIDQEQAFSKPEIDRIDLRNLFLKALQPNTVEWNKPLDSIETLSGNRYELKFKDGTVHVTDLLVGCDGAWSKVRSSFTQTKPTYSGVYFVESKIPLDRNDELAQRVIETTGLGTMCSFYNRKGILAQKNSNHVRVYYCLQMEEKEVEEYMQFEKGPEHIKEQLKVLFSGWDSSLLDFIRVVESHVMTPFAGLGANLALLDAYDLAQVLIHGGDKGKMIEQPTTQETIDWMQVITDFESKMFTRSKGAAEETLCHLNACFCEGNPDQFIQAMLSHHIEDEHH